MDDADKTHKMETRRNRVPSAKLLAAKHDEVLQQPVRVDAQKTQAPSLSNENHLEAKSNENNGAPPQELISQNTPVKQVLTQQKKMDFVTPSQLPRDPTPEPDDIIDVSGKFGDEKNHEIEIDVENIKMESSLLDDVGAEVTIESNKKLAMAIHRRRSGNFTGETLCLKTSDLSIPNKAAHFLYFRCYEENEIQKEFPLTINVHEKGPQNFLVEPRVGLKNTDYYIDSYLWNRGKSTSSKKRIYVEVEGSHVKTSRKCLETAPYVLNWYYSNMENRITKKVCWLETSPEGVRASPVLVQYNVLFVSPIPLECRKTPKLYSDTRTVAQELLRSDSPMQTVQRFMETGETDPREVINKKQAYEMRRYVMAGGRRKMRTKKDLLDMDGQHIFYDDPNGDVYEETVFYDDGIQGPPRQKDISDANRIASTAVKMVARKLESRVSALLDNRLGLCPSKMIAVRVPILANPDLQPQADQLGDWINALTSSTADDVDIVLHNVVASMRKQLEEILSADGQEMTEYIEDAPGTSHQSDGQPSAKRRHIDSIGQNAIKPDQYVTDGQEEYMFDGQTMEYVEEVIAEEIDPGNTSAEGQNAQNNGEEEEQSTRYFYPQHQGPQPITPRMPQSTGMEQ